MAHCPNCNNCIGCACSGCSATRTASDGKVVCTKCQEIYENKLKAQLIQTPVKTNQLETQS